MSLQLLDLNKLFYFVLLSIRISAIFFTVPFVESRSVPIKVKLILIILLSIIIYPTLKNQEIEFPENSIVLTISILGELFIGFIIGLVTQILFMSMYLASEIISQQMGFSIASTFNPNLNSSSSVITNFQYMLTMLIFFSTYGHHVFIFTIAESLKVVPLLEFSMSNALGIELIDLLRKAFVLAIKLAIPLIVTLIVVAIGMGIIARLVPQLNIFIINFPINIAVGLFVLSIMLFYFLEQFRMLFGELENSIFSMLNLLSH